MSTVLFPMKCVVGLPPPDTEDDGGRVLLGAWLVAALPPVVVVPAALPDAPGPDDVPSPAGVVPAVVMIDAGPPAELDGVVPAVVDDAAPVSLGGVAVPTAIAVPATAAMTTAAQTLRRANSRRPRISTLCLPVPAVLAVRRS